MAHNSLKIFCCLIYSYCEILNSKKNKPINEYVVHYITVHFCLLIIFFSVSLNELGQSRPWPFFETISIGRQNCIGQREFNAAIFFTSWRLQSGKQIEKTIATVITHLGCYECRLYSVHVVRRESELMSIRVHNAYCYMWYINTSFGNSAINIQK